MSNLSCQVHNQSKLVVVKVRDKRKASYCLWKFQVTNLVTNLEDFKACVSFFRNSKIHGSF